MLEFLFPLLPVGLVGVALWVAFVLRRGRLQAWQDAAVACGLQAVETSVLSSQLTARAGPVTVQIETCGNKGRYTRIVVRVPAPSAFHNVSIRREPLLRWAPEIETGDRSFDGTFLLEGPARQVLSLLDTETRRLLMGVNAESRLEISAGMLQASDMSDDEVPLILPLLLDISRRFAQPVDVLQRLTENAHRDPETGVRLHNLLVLARELPGEPWTIEALRTACSDRSPEIRLRAAQELGAEGRGVLLNLAEGLEDDAVSTEAVSALARELPFERTRAILDHALDRRRLRTACACLEAIGHSGDAAAAERPLIDALQREEADLRVAAANALGRVGSVEAVLPLKEAAEGSWLDRELRQAARQAIAEIQSRLQGASPGQLSLAETEAGRLSLATDPAGQLSLPPREPEARRG